MQSWILIVTAAVLYEDFALLLRLGVFCEAISVAIGCVPSIHGAIEFDCGKFKPVILIGIFLALKSDIVRYSLTKYNSIKKKKAAALLSLK